MTEEMHAFIYWLIVGMLVVAIIWELTMLYFHDKDDK